MGFGLNWGRRRFDPSSIELFDDERHGVLQREMAGINDEISMRIGMSQPVKLLVIFSLGPIQSFPLNRYRVIHLQIDEKIRVGDLKPHRGNIRMFLGNMPALIAERSQAADEGGFPRSTRPDDSN